jgi:hypothetical protein
MADRAYGRALIAMIGLLRNIGSSVPIFWK